MGRVTRAKAAEVAEKLHIDQDAVLELPNVADPTNTTPERAPLGELAPNSAESSKPEEAPETSLRKSTRGRKGGKKGAKGSSKTDLSASTASQPFADAVEEQGEITGDDHDAVTSSAVDTAAEELSDDVPDGQHIKAGGQQHSANARPAVEMSRLTVHDARSQSPPSAETRLTSSQLARKAETETEPKSLIEDILPQPEDAGKASPTTATDNQQVLANTAGKTNEVYGAMTSGSLTQTVMEPSTSPHRATSPPPSAIPKVIASLRKDTPAKRSTSNKENVEPPDEASSTPAQRGAVMTINTATPSGTEGSHDALETAVVQATTPPSAGLGGRRPSSRPEDQIAALDDFEEAVEKVNSEIPEVQASPAKKTSQVKSPDSDMPKTATKLKRAPSVRPTKASQARISLMQGVKPEAGKSSSATRPGPSTTLGRAQSVRQSTAARSKPVTGRRMPSSNTTVKRTSKPEAVDGEKKEPVIPHSKPRPVSLSFPTPPPAAKSTKAPTKSNFQLPGEAVAAKLKAARAERLAREAEAAAKKQASGTTARDDERRPAFKARSVPAGLKKTPSIRQTAASMARESLIGGKPVVAGGSHKRTQSAVPTSIISTGRPSIASRPAPAINPAIEKLAMPRQRPSSSMAATTKPRISSINSNATASISGQRSASAKSTTKGKEVFNRAANAKAEAEKERREKEEAAKKARVAAAERSRQLSRDWAEKQRLKKLGVKPEVSAAAKETKAELAIEDPAFSKAVDEGVREAVAELKEEHKAVDAGVAA